MSRGNRLWKLGFSLLVVLALAGLPAVAFAKDKGKNQEGNKAAYLLLLQQWEKTHHSVSTSHDDTHHTSAKGSPIASIIASIIDHQHSEKNKDNDSDNDSDNSENDNDNQNPVVETVVVPVAEPAPAPQIGPTIAVTAIGKPPAGEGSLVLVNYDGGGEELDVTLGNTLYRVPAETNGQPVSTQIFLPPGSYTYTAGTPGVTGLTSSIPVVAGRVLQLGFSIGGGQAVNSLDEYTTDVTANAM